MLGGKADQLPHVSTYIAWYPHYGWTFHSIQWFQRYCSSPNFLMAACCANTHTHIHTHTYIYISGLFGLFEGQSAGNHGFRTQILVFLQSFPSTKSEIILFYLYLYHLSQYHGWFQHVPTPFIHIYTYLYHIGVYWPFSQVGCRSH